MRLPSLRLFAMFRSPRYASLPHLHTMLDDIPATTEQIAKLLGLTPATIERYRREGQAPRPVMLALFWETKWGRATADCEAVNWAASSHQQAQILKRENARLVKQLLTMETEISKQKDGAANGPLFQIG